MLVPFREEVFQQLAIPLQKCVIALENASTYTSVDHAQAVRACMRACVSESVRERRRERTCQWYPAYKNKPKGQIMQWWISSGGSGYGLEAP